MAPDAPPPTYEENGNLALGWILVMRYEPSKDCVTLSWNKDGDLFRKTQQGAIAYPRDEPADQLEGLITQFYALTNPALF